MGHGTLPKLNHARPGPAGGDGRGPGLRGRALAATAVRPRRLADRRRQHDRAARRARRQPRRRPRRTPHRRRAPRRPLVIGEHNHDASADIDGDGWHGTMNYSGFSWPVWSWLRDPASPGARVRPPGAGAPATRRGGRRQPPRVAGPFGWRATTAVVEHPRLPRLRPDPHPGRRRRDVHRVAAGLQFTMPGVPMVFAGDEIGLEGVNGEDSRRTMPWHRRDEWDTDTLATYAGLARLRREHGALRRGGLRWAHVDDDTLVFLREHRRPAPAGACARRAPAATPSTLPTVGPRDAPAGHRAGRCRPRRVRRRGRRPGRPPAPGWTSGASRMTAPYRAVGVGCRHGAAHRGEPARPGDHRLPWSTPAGGVDREHVVPLPRGLCRHVVRIVRLGDRTYAVKETQEDIAFREYRLLRDLQRMGLPAVDAAGRGRPAGSTSTARSCRRR